MIISAEISYYPLREGFLEPIGDFIERMRAYKELTVRVNGMSTHVIGEYDAVMTALKNEIEQSFELPHSVFAVKLLNKDMREVE